MAGRVHRLRAPQARVAGVQQWVLCLASSGGRACAAQKSILNSEAHDANVGALLLLKGTQDEGRMK